MTPGLTTCSAALARMAGCAGIVAAAFAAGLWMQRWMAAPAHGSAAAHDLPASAGPLTNQRIEEQPALLTESDFTTAREALRAASTSNSPQHDVLAACERLLAAARTTEDFQRLIAVFNEAPQPRLLEPIMLTAFAQWAERDPRAAATGVDAVRHMHMRSQIVGKLFRQWASRDTEAALSFLESAPPGSARRDGPKAVFRAMAQVDPETAVRRALDWRFEVQPLSGLKAVFNEWVRNDMDGALDFARREMDASQRSRMLSVLMEMVPPERGWREALTLADPNSPQGKGLLIQALNRWGHHHLDEPVAAVLALPPGSTRDELLGIAAEHAAINGLRSGELLLASLPDQTTRTQWLTLLARGAMRDPGDPRPADAIRLASQLSPGDAQTQLIAEAGERWGRLDPPAASRWLVAQPPGPLRDSFVGEFVRGTFATDPAAALTWAVTIEDSGMRQERLRELYSYWHERDAAAAGAWLQESHVNTEDRRALSNLEGR